MKKSLGFILVLGFLLPFSPISAFSGSEVHISKDGSLSVTAAKVMQLAGKTFFMRLYWGDAFVRFTVKTGIQTKFLRATGELTNLSEINVGDYLDITGQLESGSDILSVIATTITNSSVQKEQASFSGKISSIDSGLTQFSLVTKNAGQVTIATDGNTVFTKGSRTLDFAHLKVGDTITKTAGDYNLPTKTLQATTVKTYVDPAFYLPKTVEGKLVEVISATAPFSIKVNISGVVYLVNLNDKTQILNKNRAAVVLNRFVVGDNIRVFGTVREIDDPVIDAEVVRNTNL